MSNFAANTLKLMKRKDSGFYAGMMDLVDFGNLFSEYTLESSDDAADARAINSDWQATGDDMREAIKKYEQDSHLGK